MRIADRPTVGTVLLAVVLSVLVGILVTSGPEAAENFVDDCVSAITLLAIGVTLIERIIAKARR